MDFKEIYKINTEALHKFRTSQIKSMQPIINEYLDEENKRIKNMSVKDGKATLLSEHNFIERGKLTSSAPLKMFIKSGDICYIDFGSRSYVQEIGYQHLALVINVVRGKALVIPITSNSDTFANGYDAIDNQDGAKFLFRLYRIKCLKNDSVMFLNDARYINTARIIEVVGNINKRSVLFQTIYYRLLECINPYENI